MIPKTKEKQIDEKCNSYFSNERYKFLNSIVTRVNVLNWQLMKKNFLAQNFRKRLAAQFN